MKFIPTDPPRAFPAGGGVTLRDCAQIELAPDEQVTFRTPAGGEYDVVRKDWGFYATPSTNGRLPRFGLRAALVRDGHGKTFIHLVERGCEAAYRAYQQAEALTTVRWLDAPLHAGESCADAE
jgi:hypothetical protein